MPIPESDSEGFLPAGVFDCTVDELAERFGAFQSTGRRPTLLMKLKEFLEELQRLEFIVSIIVDGSFVSEKPAPGDIDVILVLPGDHDYFAALRPFEYNCVAPRRVRKKFEIDLLVASENTAELREYIAYFQRVRNRTDRTKGVLRVQL
jgi:hypothetical protein